MTDPAMSDNNGRSRDTRALVSWNLAALGAGFAWFAYIDAPITDAAMWLFAAAVLVALLSLIAALVGGEAVAPVRRARARRVALLLFVAALTLLLATATLTLNLKGTASDDNDTQTSAVSRA
jgi:uncharacterized membrane protein